MLPVLQTILREGPARDAYRINYLANHFIGPVTVVLKKRWRLTRTEFNLIFTLHHADNLTARDVCEVTGRPKNSVSRAVHSLLQKGYITATPDPGDGRSLLLMLTPAGERLYQELVPIVVEREQLMFASLSPEERACLIRLLTKLIENSPRWIGIY